MRSSVVCLLLALVLVHARAAAQPAALVSGQPVWPPDCTRDMPRDGLVLIDVGTFPGAESSPTGLHVTLQRTADGEGVAGALETSDAPAGAPIRWRSHAPLAADTEYRIEAQQRDAVGSPLGAKLVSYFTTGRSFLAPLAFSGRPALRVMAHAPQADSAADREVVLLRIALPALHGGLPQRRLLVSAALTEVDAGELAAELHSRDAQAALPGQALAFELEAALRDAPGQRCIALAAHDELGQELALDPKLCVSLPARTGANAVADAEAEGPSELETSTSQLEAGQTPDAPPAAATAGGCSVSGAPGRAAIDWLLMALPALCMGRRLRDNLSG